MGSIEFRINGSLIQNITLQNLGVIEDGKYIYTYEYYEYGHDNIRGRVLHRREDGMTELCRLILEDVCSQR